MSDFRILFVCVGNVCRSPLGERLLASRLEGRGVEVSSAGVGALVGEPMTPESVQHVEAYGAKADGFVSRQLDPAMVDESDLVLTATRAIRSRVLEDSPGALRRRGDEARAVAAGLMAGAVERIAKGFAS